MYAITAALNHQEIGCHPERISKIKNRTSKYNWKHINFPSQKKDWKTFERDNEDIALNIFLCHLIKKHLIYNTYQNTIVLELIK